MQALLALIEHYLPVIAVFLYIGFLGFLVWLAIRKEL
jgi:hypothetical protein